MPTPRRRASDTFPLDPIEELHNKMDRMLLIMEEHHDENGVYFPGMSARVKRLENYLNWIVGIGTSATAAVSAYWAIIIGGKHP